MLRTPSRTPTRSAAALLAACLLAGAGACGSGDDDAAAPDPGAGAAEPGENAFPVEIEHRYGSTTIESAPDQVVTVGLTDQDAVLALGVAPVGVTDWFESEPYAVMPWAVDELGDATPAIVGTAAEINFEAVAGLQPDVILALYAGLTADDYALLSAIAPTVAQPAAYADYGIPWDEQTRTIGRVLGRGAEADALVADVGRRFADARAAHPGFAGATGVVASPQVDAVSVYAPEDSRGRFLETLGFVLPGEVADLAGDNFSADISLEQVELLEVDAVVWILGDVATDLPRLHDVPLYGRLAVVAEGREVPVANLSELGSATSFQTVLSLPILLDGLVPMLAAAVDGDPATPVPPDPGTG